MSADPGETGPATDDAESRLWVEQLRLGHPHHEEAVRRLRGVLVRVASDELSRRRGELGSIADPEYEGLARRAADDALSNILRRLDEFRDISRFTSWAFKLVVSEVASQVARYVWRGQPPGPSELAWDQRPEWLATRPGDGLEQREQLEVLAAAIEGLDDRQRDAFVAIALNDVPIDVLALQFDSTRARIYQNLFDARRTLRNRLAAAGHDLVAEGPDA